jgi:5-methylcytosine-specific restriction endonuclease McrA
MPRRRSRPIAGPPLPDPAASEPARCALCGRPLGRKVEWHHIVPRSEGGRETAPLHPICHRAIHATVPNRMLARLYPNLASLRAEPGIARFLTWIADKPPDFHAPTRHAR